MRQVVAQSLLQGHWHWVHHADLLLLLEHHLENLRLLS